MYTAGLSATLAFPCPFWFSAVWGSFILVMPADSSLFKNVIPGI